MPFGLPAILSAIARLCEGEGDSFSEGGTAGFPIRPSLHSRALARPGATISLVTFLFKPPDREENLRHCEKGFCTSESGVMMMYQPKLPDIFPEDYQSVTTEQWEAWRADVLARFFDLMGDGPTERPDPNPQIEEQIQQDGYTQQLVSYDIEEDDKGWAWVLIPEGVESPRPGVLCIHGTTADAKDACLGVGEHPGGSNGISVHLAKRGMVTMAPDHFCAGQRAPKNHPPYNTAEFYEKHPDWSEMGKDVYDHQQALDVLTAMDQVDAESIGCIGHSLGGYGTVFITAADERIKAAVSSCGITTWHCDPLRGEWSRIPPGRYKHFPKLLDYFISGRPIPVDIPEIMASIAPRCLLNISAVGNDSCFDIFEPFAEIYYQIERVYKALDAEGNFGCYFHSETHSFNEPNRALAYTWLQVKLGLGDEIELA